MKKILIVESEAIIAWSIQSLLMKKGFAVSSITMDGEEAIAHAVNGNYDLVIMDVDLCGRMSGVKVATDIHQRKKLPFLFLGTERSLESSDIDQSNMNYWFISKPFELTHLVTALNNLLPVG